MGPMRKSFAPLILCVVLILSWSEMSRCQRIEVSRFSALSDCATGKFLSTQKIALERYGISLTGCTVKCLASVTCVSINYHLSSDSKRSRCLLFSNTAASCQQIKTNADWIYLSLEQNCDSAPAPSNTGSPGPTMRSAPPALPPMVDCGDQCVNSTCSAGWQAIYEVSPLGVFGSMDCFIQAFTNGASVQVSLKQYNGNVYVFNPVEYVYSTKMLCLVFFSGPLYVYNDGTGKYPAQWEAVYHALSTCGFYITVTYSAVSQRVVRKSQLIPLDAKFYVLPKSCRPDGEPVFLTTEDSSESSAQTNSKGGRRKRGTSNFEKISRTVVFNPSFAVNIHHPEGHISSSLVDWFIYEPIDYTVGVVKLKRKFFIDSTPDIGEKMDTRFEMVMTDGRANELKLDLATGVFSLAKYPYIKQVWFTDECWQKILSVPSSIPEYSFSMSSVKEELMRGHKVKLFYFKSGVVYSSKITKTVCIIDWCVAVLENHPKWNLADPFEFFLDPTMPFVLYTSRIVGAKLYTNALNNRSFVEQKVSVTWSKDVRQYTEVFKVSKGTVQFDDLPSFIDNGHDFRLVIVESIDTSTFLDIETVMKSSVDGVTRITLYSSLVTDRPSASLCVGDPKTITTQFVLATNPFSITSSSWAWDFLTDCAVARTVKYNTISVFAS